MTVNSQTTPTYQWYKGGSAILGAIFSSYTIFSAQTNDQGTYAVKITNLGGSVMSSNAVLTVLVPVAITTQPQSQTVLAGQSVTFSVIASGTATLHYRWKFNGSFLAGSTNATLTLTNVQSNKAGSYSVVVTNLANSVTSSVATLTVNVPASITTQPLSQTVTQNVTTAFTVVASGTGPLSYQWSFNGTSLPGATNSALTLNNVQTTDAGSYTVVVTNTWASVTSAVASLTVLVPASITTQPQDQTVVAGQSATFSVMASGTAPLTYQWRLNGAAVSGGTSASLPLSNIRSNQAGSYTVVVGNSAGSVTSAVATLTVYVPAGIAIQPVSQTITQNQNVAFSVQPSGTAPFSYQWLFNGTPLTGAASASLALSNVQSNQSGGYTVVVTNTWGSVTSAVATLTVLVPAGIATQPQDQAVVVGQSATFSVVASGTAPFTYQWRLNGTAVSGGTSASLPLSNIQSNQAGRYSVVVMNAAGSVTSTAAALTVYVPATIVTQPVSQSVTQNLAATTLSVLACGTDPLSYQWSFNDTPLTDATNASLTLSNVQTTDAGSYAVVVTNAWGSVTSAVASLTVLVPAGITTQPQDQSVVAGQSATFSVVASGSAPFTYQWGLNGTAVSGGTGASLPLSNIQSNQAGIYSVVVMNSAGAATSAVATLTVYVPASIITQPASQSVTQNLAATLSVLACGTDPLSYQWSFNDTPLTDATNASLTLNNVQTTDAGSYAVVVTNAWGSATSAVANLIVLVPAGISTQPQDQAVVAGQSATFSVVASGTAPFTYQWRLNGTAVSGGTSASLPLSNIQSNQAGSYSVVVGNAAGSVTSAVATLTVYVPAGIATQPVSQTITQNQSVAFSVQPSGTAPFSYQWLFNGAALAGATSPSFALSNVQSNQSGGYTVVVTNSWGSVTSTVASLTVLVPAGITTQPQDQAVVVGQSATFSVVASGSAPFTYQWRFNGTAVSGGTSASLPLSNIQSNQAGSYTVVVGNSAGSVTSSVATLTVYVPAGIATQPVSQTITQNQSVAFSVQPSGTAPFSYLWRFNGAALPGATSASLALSNVQSNQSGGYTVVVTNSWGSVTSSVATLTVLVPAGITTQPQDQAVVVGQSATFSVVASGTAPFTYQWRLNGTAISGGTSASLPLSNIQSNQAGSYTVVVGNSAGSAISAVATLTVYVPAGIATQPVSQTITQNQNVAFSVEPSGTAPFSYQWRFNGATLTGATSPSLALSNVQSNQSGGYTVVVTNTWGSVTSAVATLTVLVPAGITTQPQDQAVVVGQSATFSVVASGSAPFSYQWRLNGTAVSGGTSASLPLSNIQSNQAGSYTVVVGNSAGSVTSAVATLTVYVPAGIATQPVSQTITQNQNVAFSVQSSGTAPFSYQWRFNGATLTGATSPSLALSNVQSNQSGGYTVVVTNTWGSVTSAVANLTVLVPAGITTQPQDQAVVVGQSATFSVVASGSAPFTYQWRLNGAAVSGGTSASLPLSNIQSNQAGSYTVVVGNSAGSMTSSVATLTVYVPAGIATQPVSQTITQNQSVAFSVQPSGTAPFSYQWLFNGTALAGATSPSLALSNVQSNQSGGYTVVVTNTWGSVTSAVANLTVLVPAGIATQPQDQAVVVGQSATFSVLASGTTPFTYQWRFNGAAVSGATSASLPLSNIQSNQAGSYTVVVGNSAGSVTSSVATLTVYVPAGIATQPVSQTITQNQNVVFSVQPSGTAPFSYQWRFNGAALTGATSPSLALSNVQSNQSGGYTVVVTNAWGSVTSAVATLTVLVPAGISTQPQDQTVVVGQSATFSVVASGTAPFTYQWRLNGVAVSGGTSASLPLSNIQSNQAGSYTVVVGNSAGSVTSAVATLTVYVPAGIATQPVSQTITQNQSVAFSVQPSGTAPFSYQWRFNGTALAGATSATLALSNVQSNQSGGYTVVVTNSWGSVTSAVANLTVLVPAGISTQPQDQTVVVGQSATFSVVASGTAPFTYQWRLNGAAVSGGTSASLPLSNIQSNQAGSYTVVVGNSAGSVTSSVATLTVYVPAGIATQPVSQTITQNQSVALSVQPSGTAPFSYQWSFNGAALTGATSPSLVLINVQSNQSGGYTVVVTNTWGSVTSAVATLTVLVPAGITTQPQDQAVAVGQSATFSVVASGTAPFTYQWRLNGTAVSGGTSASLPLSNIQSNQAGSYTVVVGNSAGSVTSSVATLTVYVPVGITTQPVSQTVTQGMTASLSVVASGTAPFSYQWQYLGTNLAGATNSTLLLPNIQFVQAGQYGVTVSNQWSGAISAPASLAVIPPPSSDLPVMQGLVAHLAFDGDLRDSSGRGNHAAPVGAPNLVPGFIGAGGFNPFTQGSANNYATFGTPTDLAFGKNTDFSVAFWARLPAGAWNGGATHMDPAFISNKDWSSGANVGWVIATGADGRLQWNYTENASQSRKDYDGPGGVFGQPVWHHVAITFRRTVNAITYLDGLPVSTNSIAPGSKFIDSGLPTNVGNDGTGNYPLTYGYWTNALANPATGLNMDDVAIWSRVLTAQEICAIYNVGLDGQDLATVASPNLTTVARPRIFQSPASSEVLAGSNPAFSVSAIGSALAYQWYGNGAAINGGTNASLTLFNVQPAQAGNYLVVITNSSGNATSQVATLTVDTPPAITTQPQSQTVAIGQTASFSIVATSAFPVSYQWNCNGSPLAGATNSTLVVTGVHTNNAGNYTVMVSNMAGGTSSAAATLIVTNPSVNLSLNGGQAVTSSGFTFRFSVPSGSTYVIQASTNLINWTSIATNAGSGASTFTDPFATNYPRRFYRVMVP